MNRCTLHFILAWTLLAGCDSNDPYDNRMVVQPKYEVQEPSALWTDGTSARPPIAGTVPITGLPVESKQLTAKGFPFPLERKDLERGQKLYNIHCAVCHGALGDGNGIITQRGLKSPPSFYLARLRQAPPAHFYEVISNGYGIMYSYDDQVSSADRWRITGYVRALQLSDTSAAQQN